MQDVVLCGHVRTQLHEVAFSFQGPWQTWSRAGHVKTTTGLDCEGGLSTSILDEQKESGRGGSKVVENTHQTAGGANIMPRSVYYTLISPPSP
jgi:hypothetical protein